MGNRSSQSKCEVCASPFTPNPSGKPQKYCSNKCRAVASSRKFRADNPDYGKKYRKVPTEFKEKSCRYCGSNFKPLRNNHIFCSDACAVSASLVKRKTLATCRECGARFSQEIKNQRYCEKCKNQQRQDRSNNNEVKSRLYKETKLCTVCGEKFTAYRSTSLYCSRVCAGIASRRRVSQNLVQSIGQAECQYCGETFQQKISHQRFCSKTCSQMQWHYSKNGQDKRFWTNYRIRYEVVEKILEMQGNACFICDTAFTGSRKTTVHVDHDHSCCESVPTCGKCNRGLICGNCNTMLGMAKDNASILEKAANYLRTSRLPSPE